jgi:hypothetical protein
MIAAPTGSPGYDWVPLELDPHHCTQTLPTDSSDFLHACVVKNESYRARKARDLGVDVAFLLTDPFLRGAARLRESQPYHVLLGTLNGRSLWLYGAAAGLSDRLPTNAILVEVHADVVNRGFDEIEVRLRKSGQDALLPATWYSAERAVIHLLDLNELQLGALVKEILVSDPCVDRLSDPVLLTIYGYQPSRY